MTSAEKIPIIVLTGFLGSGKTVLLNALLRQPGFADSAIVVNEFGEIGLDHLLVASAEENIVLLDAGCLCCAVLGSLKETLLDLWHRRARSQVPPFRRVLVETTGLADPGPIIQSIMRDSVVTHFYRLAGLVCALDAVHGEGQLQGHPEARAQVACADRLVVTKTDLLDGACPPALVSRVRSLNPDADLLVASHGQLSADALLQPAAGKTDVPWLGRLAATTTSSHEAHDGHDLHAHHDPDVGSVSFVIDDPVTWSGLAAWIQALRQRYGRTLLRCKGIVNIAGAPVVVHGVQSMFDTRRLPDWPDAERRSRLVLIGKGLERAELDASLGWLGTPEGMQPPLDGGSPPPARAANAPSNRQVGVPHAP
jgi:G3E family GTPase